MNTGDVRNRDHKGIRGRLSPRFLAIWLAVAIGALGLLLAACGGGGSDAATPTPLTLGDRELTPVPANSELVVGPNKFGLGLVDADTEPILGAPGTTLRLRFSFGDELREETDARFLWAIPDVSGFWRADIDFEEAGQWKVEAVLTQDGEELTVTFTFLVREDGLAPTVGEPVPAITSNLTLAREPNIKRLSTDQEPELALYQMTVAEALETGRPLVVVFATPAFCETRFCGPVLDNVKEVWREFGDRVDFIHIEPFELDDEGQLVTVPRPEGGADRVLSPPMLGWNLQSEPWVFVIDAQGRVATRFEGTATADEVREALSGALGS